MTTADGQIGELRNQIGDIRSQFGDMRGQIGELRGSISGVNNRIDDLHRLLMVLIGIAGGGLVTAVIAVVLQLVG